MSALEWALSHAYTFHHVLQAASSLNPALSYMLACLARATSVMTVAAATDTATAEPCCKVADAQTLILIPVKFPIHLSACRWLVGLSYRVVYNKDPVPFPKAKSGLLASQLVHVHGEIYIQDGSISALGRSVSEEGIAGDHEWARYACVRLSHSIC